LGIQRKSKSLTYSTQRLSGAELSTVKDPNVINGLAGKAAGVTITRSASGVGGSARVIMRGNKSTRENQPLYVIDGVPVANFTPAQPTDVWGQSSGAGSGGRDGGDGISNINPDDIESINLLKGASASALYGSQAANGVILITTKRGKSGQARIDFSSNYSAETPLLKPELQYRYGQTVAPTGSNTGTAESWGSKVSAPDHVDDFFRTGNTWINSLSLSGGNQIAQTYFSYSNTSSNGMMPSSEFDRHTFNFRESLKLFKEKLSIDANMTFVNQENKNRPVSGMYNNPLTGLYLFPRGQSFATYRDNYEYMSPSRNMMLQNWWNINYDKGWGGDDNQQNPYWALYRNIREDSRNRGLASVTLKYQMNNWLSVQARGSFDKSFDKYELKSYAGTQSVLAASNGRYTLENATNTQLYGDLIATATPKIGENFSLTANLGTSILDLEGNNRTFFDTDPNSNPGLGIANKFVVSNITPNALFSTASVDNKQVQSLFASGSLGFHDNLFLDVTVRNDWSSTLAFTPDANNGFIYYSAGLTAVISDMVKLPEFISFGKARVSYARVGNDITPYATNPPYKYVQTSNGEVKTILNTKAPYPGTYLRPEDNRSIEIGTEWRFAHDRIGFDLTFYKNNNYRQYMEVPAPLGSGYSVYYLNLGNIENKGIEAVVTLVPVKTKSFSWTSSFNLASNKNKVVSLSDAGIPGSGVDNPFTLTGFGVNMYASYIREGGSWGDIYANKQLVKDANGSIKLDADGKPITENIQGLGKLVGNPNPDFSLGWNNSIEYKRIYANVLIDGRFGGEVMSVTQAVNDKYGVSETTAAARDAGGVSVDAVNAGGSKVTTVDAQKYYQAVGGRDGVGELYIYDATNIRLRELAVGYSFPSFSKAIKDIRLGFVGRNLFLFNKKAPFDPETSAATSNALQGVDVFGMPSARSYGLNLKFVF
jgi:TonB-linked SusC/RagA family outer membrane protein